jgi:hypothetical protein
MMFLDPGLLKNILLRNCQKTSRKRSGGTKAPWEYARSKVQHKMKVYFISALFDHAPTRVKLCEDNTS